MESSQEYKARMKREKETREGLSHLFDDSASHNAQVDRVVSRIKRWVSYMDDPVDIDYDHLNTWAKRLINDGFYVIEAVKFLKCTEELNPSLDEDVALRRMSLIIEGMGDRYTGKRGGK